MNNEDDIWNECIQKARLRAQKRIKKEREQREQRIKENKAKAVEHEESIEAFQSEMARMQEDFREDIFNHEAYFVKNTINKDLKAFHVYFKGFPNLHYISFRETRDRARSEAVGYFQRTMFPQYSFDHSPASLKKARALRVPAFDEYRATKRVPIIALLKEGFKLPCSYCGKYSFDYTAYEYNQCFVVEGEGNANTYTEGLLACKDCYRKLG